VREFFDRFDAMSGRSAIALGLYCLALCMFAWAVWFIRRSGCIQFRARCLNCTAPMSPYTGSKHCPSCLPIVEDVEWRAKLRASRTAEGREEA
jgi:hypothetical protein